MAPNTQCWSCGGWHKEGKACWVPCQRCRTVHHRNGACPALRWEAWDQPSRQQRRQPMIPGMGAPTTYPSGSSSPAASAGAGPTTSNMASGQPAGGSRAGKAPKKEKKDEEKELAAPYPKSKNQREKQRKARNLADAVKKELLPQLRKEIAQEMTGGTPPASGRENVVGNDNDTTMQEAPPVHGANPAASQEDAALYRGPLSPEEWELIAEHRRQQRAAAQAQLEEEESLRRQQSEQRIQELENSVRDKQQLIDQLRSSDAHSLGHLQNLARHTQQPGDVNAASSFEQAVNTAIPGSIEIDCDLDNEIVDELGEAQEALRKEREDQGRL